MNDQDKNTTAVLTLEQVLAAIATEQATITATMGSRTATKDERARAANVWGAYLLYGKSQTHSMGEYLKGAYTRWKI